MDALYRFLLGLSYGPVINVGVNPVIKHNDGQWCHQGGSYCVPSAVIISIDGISNEQNPRVLAWVIIQIYVSHEGVQPKE